MKYAWRRILQKAKEIFHTGRNKFSVLGAVGFLRIAAAQSSNSLAEKLLPRAVPRLRKDDGILKISFRRGLLKKRGLVELSE